jgi:hypothetical protein
MIVKRLSQLTGHINEMDISITPQQLVLIENRTKPIQQIAPQLTDEEREFLITGMTKEEWLAAFPVEDEE